MRKIFTFILLVFVCISGYAQTIDPVLLQEMGQRGDDEKIKVIVIMKSQYDRQQLNRRAAHYVTRADRREFVVNELKQFAEASQYDLRRSLDEMERNDMTTTPKIIWMANAMYFSATKQAINDLAMRRDIEIIGFDEKRYALFGEETKHVSTNRGITFNVTQVNADQVWSLGYTGQGVVVAVIDTGVNYNHLDLADHLWDGGAEFPHHGYDFYNEDNDPMDDYGHGTHCAGTVCGDGTAGQQTGMAPDATLMCLKVLDSGGWGEVSITCNAMQWAVEHGCDLFSMSLGWADSSIAERTLFRNTCVAVLDAGVIGAIAAGNEGDYQWELPIPNNVRVPGSCPPPYMDPIQANNAGGLSCSVCVGAVDEYDNAAYFTSRGPVTWSNTSFGDYPYMEGSTTDFGLIRPDVCAPGVDVISADCWDITGYLTMSGTSMATPCVAGCISLMLSKNINATPAEICQVLEETAVSLETGKSNTYGYGRVDALAAVSAMYSGPLTLESFALNDGQGNNDGKLNAGELVTLDFTLTNDSEVALDGVTLLLSSSSEYVTITNGTATLPHFDAGETQTMESLFAFTLSDDAPAKRAILLSAEAFANGESLGVMQLSVMVYGPLMSFDEVLVLNDNNGNGSLEAGETADLHVTVSNIGNDIATSTVGTLSTTYPYLVINSNGKSFEGMDVNGQASADFSVTLSNDAPDGYTIDFSLDLVDGNAKHYVVEFELWRKAITLTSNPAGAGTLTGAGNYGQGQSCTISATANEGYVFSKWSKDGTRVSCFPTYSFTVTDEAEYVADFRQVDGIVIGDDAPFANVYLPTNFVYKNSLTQQIFTAAEMGGLPCEISSVSFFNTSYYRNRNLNVYLVHTDKTCFENNTDWITVTEEDMVYSGNVSITSYGWANIYFTTPFNYDGSSNVALIVDDNSTNTYSSNLGCRTFNTAESQAICIYSSNTNYDPYQPSQYTGTLMMEKNQVVFGYARYIYTVTTTADPVVGGEVNGGGDLYYYGQPVSVNATANPGYVFNFWKKNNSVVSCFPTYNFTVTASAEYVASFKEVDGIAIGEPTYTNDFLPTYTYYPYSYTQQIYTAAELNAEACEISSVSFFNTGYDENRVLTIYMVNTDKMAFDNESDWINVTEADQVFSGQVTTSYHNWSTIYFNTPFLYDGSSNVALVVYDKTNQWGWGMSCRTFDTESAQAIYYYSEYNIDPNELGGVGTCVSVKNQVIFGIPSYDYTMTLSANPEEGGTVSGGGGSYYYGQPVPVEATANPGYVFNYWTKYVDDYYGYGYDEVVSYFSPDNLPVTEDVEYVAQFQQMDGVAIGEATHASAYLPVYSDYPYSMTQQIYTADELNMGMNEISSVSFFNTGYYTYRNLSIYMVNTDKAAFEHEYDWIAVTEADMVFSGSVEFSESGWTTIYFNTTFVYDGYSNIALIVNDMTEDWGWGMTCRTFDSGSTQAIYTIGDEYAYWYGYGYPIDPYYPFDYYGTLMSEKNQVVFGIPSYDFMVTVSASPEEGGTVSGGGGPYFYGQPITISATANPGYVFDYWTKYDEWNWYNEIVSYLSTDNVSVTESADYVAHFEQMDGIIIGEANHSNYCLPINCQYPTSLSQQIYTADELNTEACEISSVSFFNTEYGIQRDVDIFMVNTNKTCFSHSADWITVTEADLVFSGNIYMTGYGWTTIYFSTPFNYDGSSNVALVVNDKTDSWDWGGQCRTFDTDVTQALYTIGYDEYYGNSYIIDPYHLTTAGTLLSEKNQVVLGIASYDYTVTVSANPEEGGTVSGGGGPYYYGQPVTVSATANEGYVFYYWSENGYEVSTDATYTFPVMDNMDLVANFGEPINITVSANPAEGGSVSITGTFDYGSSVTITATANEGYVFTRWTCNGNAVSYLSKYTFEVSATAEYVAEFEWVYPDIAIGDANASNIYLPGYAYYPYSLTQQIYTAEEIGKTCQIHSISLFNTGSQKTRDYTIYLVHTNKSSFEGSYDWIPVTESDQVFSGSVTMKQKDWTVITLDTPFNYDGTSNLALIFDDNSGNYSYSGSMYCRVFNTTGYQAIRTYSSTTNYNPYSPSDYYGYRLRMKNQIILGCSYSITATADPVEGGTVTGSGHYESGTTCTLTATPSNGYLFLNWTENGEVVSNDPTYSFTVESDKDIVANFIEFAYHWTPVGGNEFNMTLNGIILIDGVEQTVPTLEVGAFCGEECRGRERAVLFPPTGQYVVAMTVGSNMVSGEVITFRLYDHAAQQELNVMSIHSLTFEDNLNLGTMGDWYLFEFGTIVQQEQTLNEGWNWWSTYIEQEGFDGLTMLENSLGSSGVLIKSQEHHVQNYFDTLGQNYWFGSLSEYGVQNEKSYLINVSEDCTSIMTGVMAHPEDHPITLHSGWNWVGYPVSIEQGVESAMPSDFVPANNDVIKSQDAYATYNEEYGWFPSSFTLVPGLGYKYSSQSEEEKTMVYAVGERKELQNVCVNHYWQNDAHRYANNLSVMAVVTVDGEEQKGEHIELGAFVDGECRGSAILSYFEPFDRWYAVLTVSGEDGEQIEFGLVDKERSMASKDSNDRLVFVTDAIVGNLDHPFAVHFGAMNDMNEMLTSVSVYPNPVDRNAPFTLAIPEGETVAEVLVVNAMGEVVKREIGNLMRSTMEGLSTAGIYMVKLTCKSGNMFISRVVVK